MPAADPRNRPARVEIQAGPAASPAAPRPHTPPRPLLDPRVERWMPLGLLVAGAFVALTAWVAGAWAVALVVAVVFACAAQGWWRGAGEVVGLLAGTLAAVVVAPRMGPLIDGPVAAIFGTAGLQTRVFGIALTFVLVMAVVAGSVGLGVRRWTRGRAALARWNRAAGGALGLGEGVVLGLAILWVPLSLEPVARARLATGDEHAASRGVAGFAEHLRGSMLGGLAEGTNPLRGSEILAMAESFAIISRSERAMAWFVEQAVMRRVRELPSVQGALARLEAEPALRDAFGRSSEVSAEWLLALMRSDVVLEILDGPSLVSDLRPMVPDIREALRGARAIAEGAGGR